MDHGTRHSGSKRKRVSKACDRCRGKKYRCDGQRPACVACRESGHDCSYDPTAKKRGLPEGYVRGLEKLWALSISNIAGLEEGILEMLGSKEAESSRRQWLVSLWNNERASERLHDIWKSSELYASVEELLLNPGLTITGTPRMEEDRGGIEPEHSLSDIASDSQLDDCSDHHVGEILPWALTQIQHKPPRSPDTDARRVKFRISSPTAERNSRMKLPIQTSHLLDMYFAHTHSWFPILAKHEILKASYQYLDPTFETASNLAGSGNHAALWAILSYTAAQIPPDTEENSTAGTRFRNPGEEAKGFYAVARSLIPDERGKFEIEHVQATLLLTLVNIGFGDWTAAWVLCGQAASVAIDLGLGAASRSKQSPGKSKEEETFLGCFLLDTLLSARLARCPRMRSDTIRNVNLLEEDGLEEWGPWVDVFLLRKLHGGENSCPRGPLRSCSTFNRLLELSKLLHLLWDNLPLAPDVTAMAHEYFLRNLKHWEMKLPPGCRLSDVSKKMLLGENLSFLPHQTFLLWTQMAALILLSTRLSPHIQQLSYSLRQVMDITLSLLTSQSQNFTQTCLPPPFEFSLRIIVDAARSQASSRYHDTSWLESVASQISRAGGIWPVYSSLVEDTRQLSSAVAPPSLPILHLASSRSNLAPPHPHCSPPPPPPRESVYDILEVLESFLQEDADARQPNEEDLTFFSLLSRAPMDQFSASDCRSRSEASIIPSSQGFDDVWAGLQSPTPATREIPWMTPNLSKTREGENSPPSPRSDISNMCKANQKETYHHLQPLNDGYTLGPQKATPQFPNHKSPSPASPSPPASNDIESIFHDRPNPNNSDISTSKPHKAFLTRTLNYESSHARLIIDIYDDKSSHDALLNDHDNGSSTGNSAEELPGQNQEDGMEEEGKGKQTILNKIMCPPSIADIWPPPGFFPDAFGEEGERGVEEAGEKMDVSG
ncbi:hypothetical protein RJZ56_001316 [Blastomyces dermatitidis]|uniref:C6 transcription factor n=2 Tax=Ajellomyces dermatitidis TaxID=5039 RepID=F2T5D8_AJEDA|nr:C6 transcription factor [Blastomyces dermatitidis ER-3]EEQ85295.1 C6 transcription factor [Blastomyces dermatitidis ER-3]EGE78363.1 C6 transcription factor [Blastomyces dermatitidis ATCC 18188]